MQGRIFSIGYGNHSPDVLLDQLLRADIGYVVDVRSSPFSRFKPEFSREPLAHYLKNNGIKYVFMGDLLGGRPQDDDCYSEGKVDYTKIRQKEFFARGIERLKKAYEQGFNVCMLCSEALPSQCHRAKLISVALGDKGIDVSHILPNGERQTQADVINGLTRGQANLFDEHFTSRKTYR